MSLEQTNNTRVEIMSKEEEKKRPGRPHGTARGRKATITIAVSDEHKEWLVDRGCSYAKSVARLINNAIDNIDPCGDEM